MGEGEEEWEGKDVHLVVIEGERRIYVACCMCMQLKRRQVGLGS